MRIIVSSKAMVNCLQRLELDSNWVYRIKLIAGELMFFTASNIESVIVESSASEYDCAKIDARWDWVYQTLSSVEEQPVVLEIYPNSVNVIFNY